MAPDVDIDKLCKQARQEFRKKMFDQAIYLFQQVVEVDPDRSDVHNGLASAYFLTKQYKDAVQHFERVSQLKPLDGNSLINIGAAYNRMGNYTDAALVLQRGLQKSKGSSEGYYNLGIAHRHLNQLTMAVNAYREAIRLDPDMVEAHQNLANVYFEIGSYTQSIQYYNQALKIRPGFERAQRGLQQAEELAERSRQDASPFGRLVDEADYLEQADETEHRTLTVRERIEDRQEIQTLTEDILEYVQTAIGQLRDEMLPSLHLLDRSVAKGIGATTSVHTAREEFQSAVERCAELRKQLVGKLSVLRTHEQKMGSFQVNADV